MNIIPLRNSIFVLPDKVIDKTNSGLILTDYSKKRPTSGTIIAIGEKFKFPLVELTQTVYEALLPYWNCICNNEDYPEVILAKATEKITEVIKNNLHLNSLKIGQRVIYGEFSGHKQIIDWNGEDVEIFIMTPNDILALLE